MKKGSARQNFAVFELVESLDSMISPSILGPLHFPAYCLPADRTGIMHARNAVVTALIASASAAGLRPAARMPMLSEVRTGKLSGTVDRNTFKFSRGFICSSFYIHGSGTGRKGKSSLPNCSFLILACLPQYERPLWIVFGRINLSFLWADSGNVRILVKS